MNVHTTTDITRESAHHVDVAARETTVAVAEVAPRDIVRAEAHVETSAPEKFAAAADEKDKALRALSHKEMAHAEAHGARPLGHAADAIGDLGDKIGAKWDARQEGKALEKHANAAVSETERAHTERIESKEAARQRAINEAEAKAVVNAKGSIVSEFRQGKEIVVVAEVPARGPTVGTGVAESHADDHLLRAARERELAAEAAAAKADAEARLAHAHPGAEAKAAVGGIGTKISARLHEAKEWMSEKLHDRRAESLETSAVNTLEKDVEAAREKAKAAAEAEARRLDRNANAEIISEKTVATVTASHNA